MRTTAIRPESADSAVSVEAPDAAGARRTPLTRRSAAALTVPVAVVLQVLTASTVPEPTSPPIQVPLSGPPPVSPVRVAVSSRILPVPDAVAVKRESSLSVLPVRLRIQATRAPATATASIRCPADSSEPHLPVFGPLTSAAARVAVFQVKSLKQFVGANAWVA